jgi:hypothetical protein
MSLQPIAFARAHHCAAATHFRGRYACMEATSMAEADLLSTSSHWDEREPAQ